MAEQMVGRFVTIMSKWLHIFLIHISVIHRNLYYFTFIFQSVYVIAFFPLQFFYTLTFLQLIYLYGYTFSKGKDHIHTLNTMMVKYWYLVRNRADLNNHKAVQFYCCDRWVHIDYNYLNVYTYRKLHKDKSPWYCLCCLKKETQFCSFKNEHLQELMHGKIILSPNKKIITNTIRKNEIID